MAIMIRCSCQNEYSRQKHSVCPKCGNKKGHKGNRYKVVVVRGGRKTTEVVKTLSLAEEIEHKMKNARKLSKWGIFDCPRLDDVFQSHIESAKDVNSKRFKKSWDDDEQRYKKFIKKTIGNLLLSEITSDDITMIVACMGSEKNEYKRVYSNGTKRQVLALIRMLYGFAKSQYSYDGPVPDMGNIVQAPAGRSASLGLDDAKHFIKIALSYEYQKKPVLAEMAKTAIVFFLLTGRRRGEVFSLEWKDVNFDYRYIVFKNTKSGHDVVTPFSKGVEDVLNKLLMYRNDISDLVWHLDGRSFYNSYDTHFRNICKLSGVVDKKSFRSHDLRHTFGTVLGHSESVSPFVLQTLMGHRSYQTTEKYLHPVTSEQRKAADYASNLFIGELYK